jgi:hypothetical protein
MTPVGPLGLMHNHSIGLDLHRFVHLPMAAAPALDLKDGHLTGLDLHHAEAADH